MKIFPAIDIIDGKAVRLFKGDYAKMTVYNDDPLCVARDIEKKGSKHIHLVDLDGAKSGATPNINVIERIVKNTDLFTELGGGIRSMETVDKYLNIGVNRVIIGTAAVTDRDFLLKAIEKYGERIAVGVDIKDGFVAIKGWMEKSSLEYEKFIGDIQNIGVKTAIITDISKDGAMKGTNRKLYEDISEKFSINVVASGGVSTIDDVKALSAMGIYGAIIGKAFYIGQIDLSRAIEVAG